MLGFKKKIIYLNYKHFSPITYTPQQNHTAYLTKFFIFSFSNEDFFVSPYKIILLNLLFNFNLNQVKWIINKRIL